MTRLEQLEAKLAEAVYEVTRANNERIEAKELDKHHKSSTTGGMVKIGARETHAGDYQTQFRLWTEEHQRCCDRRRSLKAAISREARKVNL
jgi:hypothetical protein